MANVSPVQDHMLFPFTLIDIVDENNKSERNSNSFLTRPNKDAAKLETDMSLIAK